MKIKEIISNSIINRDALGLRYIKSSMAGYDLMVHPKDWRFWSEVNKKNWEPETIEFMVENVFRGSHYCDIGAFVGPTVLLARKLGAKVTCFEPDPEALERLYFNVRMNADDGVDIFPVALGARDSVVSMASVTKYLGQAATTIHSTNFKSPTFKALMLSWKTALMNLESPCFDTIKIDIEGGESELLPAMLDYLEKFKPKLHLSTHFHFIPENKQESFLETLKQLWGIYKKSDSFPEEIVKSGTPNFFF